jgi:hypothetical protein
MSVLSVFYILKANKKACAIYNVVELCTIAAVQTNL